ncbi:MAG: UDP-N-acetylmuramoyl-L-alanine--D-glutamate ligase [Rikenellaceae bacterium]
MKRVIILGAGESGVGSAILAKKMEYEVFLTDSGSIKPHYKEMLNQWDIEYEELGHTLEKLCDAELCIKSPGIPDSVAVVSHIKENGIAIISEIEFAYRYSNAKTICITGSNGKTTTATFTYNILKNAGYNVALVGNIGQSYAYMVATADVDYYVLELSSFQLDGMFNFKADVAIITNITPDHLDRYNYDFNLYRRSKFRITQNMTKEDCLIYSTDDENTLAYIFNNQELFTMYNTSFSTKDTLLEGGYINQKGDIELNIEGHELIIERDKIKLMGTHNLYNIMAASLAALRLGVDSQYILQTAYSFEGVEHRMEIICKKDDVIYINDSKATNVDAAYYALQSIDRPIVWVAGGTDKGNDYSILKDVVKGKVTTLVCMGLDNKKLVDSFTSVIPFIYSTSSLEEAVEVIRTIYKPGDCVLLSPACASFDLFDNYMHRGEMFKQAILKLEPKIRE